MKATLGGYRHLVRKAESAAADSTARLKEILTKDFPEAFNAHLAELSEETEVQPGDEALPVAEYEAPEAVKNVLGNALKTLTLVADHRFDGQAKDSLWPFRMDRPLHQDPGQLQDIWDLLGKKVAEEPLDSDLSLVRVFNAVVHLGACCELSLKDIADWSMNEA